MQVAGEVGTAHSMSQWLVPASPASLCSSDTVAPHHCSMETAWLSIREPSLGRLLSQRHVHHRTLTTSTLSSSVSCHCTCRRYATVIVV